MLSFRVSTDLPVDDSGTKITPLPTQQQKGNFPYEYQANKRSQCCGLPTLLPRQHFALPLRLFCLTYGDPFARAFEVEIDRDRSISALKKSIVGVKANYFKDIDAEVLDLWKREIPIVDNDPASQTPTLSPDDQPGVAKTVIGQDGITQRRRGPVKVVYSGYLSSRPTSGGLYIHE